MTLDPSKEFYNNKKGIKNYHFFLKYIVETNLPSTITFYVKNIQF
jgi:hypothetical protein